MRISGNVINTNGISERIIQISLKVSKRYILVLTQVYAPTTSYIDEEVDYFYEQVAQCLSNKKNHYNVVIGDFNAKVGKKLTVQEKYIEIHGLGTRNERGQKLLDFATAQNTKIANTFFKKQKTRKWTWRSPNSEQFNEIDYILCRWISSLKM